MNFHLVLFSRVEVLRLYGIWYIRIRNHNLLRLSLWDHNLLRLSL
jgi:hypothetical protein